MGSAQSASAGYYGYSGYNHGYVQHYYQPACFIKKVKVWGHYGYHWKKIRVCH